MKTKIFNINREWYFIVKEINKHNHGGSQKGELLFEFQILLDFLSRLKFSEGKRLIESFYKKEKIYI